MRMYLLMQMHVARNRFTYSIPTHTPSYFPTIHHFIYIYIYYIYVYLKSIGATFFFREDSVIYLVGLAAQKLDAKEAGYEGNLGDFVIGLV